MNSKKQHRWGSIPDLSGPWHFYRERLITKYLTALLGRGHILDCGFGSGTLIIELARRGFQVTGIDTSSEFIYYVHDKTKEGKITIIRGDVAHLNFCDGCFDGVVCGEVFEHIKNDRSAVLELYRVVKKGGFCVITVPACDNLWSCVDEWAGHYRRYSEKSVRKLLESSGFNIKKIQYYGFPMGLLYHKFIFIPLLKRRIQREKKGKYWIQSKFGGFYRRMAKAISYIFYLDHLISNHSMGNGLIVLCQK